MPPVFLPSIIKALPDELSVSDEKDDDNNNNSEVPRVRRSTSFEMEMCVHEKKVGWVDLVASIV